MNKAEIKKEMLEKYNCYEDDKCLNFDFEAAWWWLCALHHHGPSDWMYEELGKSEFHPSPLHRGVKDEGEVAEMMYNELVQHIDEKGHWHD